ncbi:MAG: N-6 DNA methylase [Spirochaetales bacterium]|jgi:type I restriction-modification system DNA methylase subunit|nr:N-6 DNA methylase [Spirochaetales bacterium]
MKKEKLCEELGVSLATINNWIKTQVIPPPDLRNCYSGESFARIIQEIKSNPERLNSRANRTLSQKTELSYLGITGKDRKKLLSNLVDDFKKSGLTAEEGVLALSFAVLRSNKLIDEKKPLNSKTKIDALISDWIKTGANPHIAKTLYSKYEIPNEDDDIIGAFYQSIKSIAQKSHAGLYYTPPKLLKGITMPSDKTVLDPCCGSGGILLKVLTKSHDPSKIYACDTDETALKICFVNLVLFFNSKNITPHILKNDLIFNNGEDLLFQKPSEGFDYIITNPPWGSQFTPAQKKFLINSYPELATSEAFSIALYNALKRLKKKGTLYFFLPHAFLNVATHKNIRHYVLTRGNEVSIKLLGSPFKGVLSGSILLKIKNSFNKKGLNIQNGEGNIYQAPLQSIAPPGFIVSAAVNAQDSAIIDKIYNTGRCTLQNDAVFALGIVLGNNKKHLLCQKTEKSEAIFRGKDIEKYLFSAPKQYLEFEPGLYQQAAPIEYYRQKKIVYRFISDKLICVLDKSGSLVLNSANLFIAKKYPMETITALFNSDIYTFIFQKKFNSKKILKSHLQNLPLPLLDNDTHRFIYALYKKTLAGNKDGLVQFQNKIDQIICHAFSINAKQYNYIKAETSPEAILKGRPLSPIPR